MSLETRHLAANDPVFQGRCFVALMGPAQDITNEATNTPDHQARLDWARRVFTDSLNISGRVLALQVLRNATIAALPDPTTADDASIEYQVTQVLGDLIAIG